MYVCYYVFISVYVNECSYYIYSCFVHRSRDVCVFMNACKWLNECYACVVHIICVFVYSLVYMCCIWVWICKWVCVYMLCVHAWVCAHTYVCYLAKCVTQRWMNVAWVMMDLVTVWEWVQFRWQIKYRKIKHTVVCLVFLLSGFSLSSCYLISCWLWFSLCEWVREFAHS